MLQTRNEQSKEYYLERYHPYWHGKNPNFNDFSRKILDLKGNIDSPMCRNAINYFFEKLSSELPTGVAISYIPSSDMRKVNTGVKLLAVKLCGEKGRVDLTDCIRRKHSIEKLASGGSRDIEVHLESLEVINYDSHDEKTLYILDDVTKTGNSFKACLQLFRQAGAKSEIHFIALGAT